MVGSVTIYSPSPVWYALREQALSTTSGGQNFLASSRPLDCWLQDMRRTDILFTLAIEALASNHKTGSRKGHLSHACLLPLLPKQYGLQFCLLLLGITGHILVPRVTIDSRNKQAETAESDDSMVGSGSPLLD